MAAMPTSGLFEVIDGPGWGAWPKLNTALCCGTGGTGPAGAQMDTKL